MSRVELKKINKNEASVLAKHGISVFAGLDEKLSPSGYFILESDCNGRAPHTKSKIIPSEARVRLVADHNGLPRKNSKLRVSVDMTIKYLSAASDRSIKRGSLTQYLSRELGMTEQQACSHISDMLHRYGILEAVK